jgi:hypothetical protein
MVLTLMPDLLDLMERPTYPDGVPQDVCLLFEKLSLEVAAMGFERYSARAVLHRIRWHHQIERGERGFKANNNWTPAMSRWFMKRNPRLDGFFELRERTEIEDDV